MVQTPSAQATSLGRQSVEKLQDLVAAGRFWSQAEVDRQTGEVRNSEARALFAALPAVTPATVPEELLENGLLARLPNGLHRANEVPSYHAGRELFVRTTIDHQATSRTRPVGRFQPSAPLGFTHRSTLRAQKGEEFLIEIPGSPSLLSFPKIDVYSWNEPIGVPASGGAISGVQIDYNDPLWKAHICAGYLDISEEMAKLDFLAGDAEAEDAQRKILHRVAARISMDYAGRGEGYSGARAGPLMSNGQGVCFVQRAVAGAYLQAFARALALDVQIAVGSTLQPKLAHGFVVITIRPSMSRYVCDPAWSEPLTDLRVAFFGTGWGHNRRLEGFEGSQDLTVRPEEIDLPTEDGP